MSESLNSRKLPPYLHYSPKEGGYFLDWRYKVGAVERRKRKVLGFIPKAHALKIHGKFYQDMQNKSYGLEEKPKISLSQAIESFLIYSRGNKRTSRMDEYQTEKLLAFFGDIPVETLNLDLVERYREFRKQEFLAKRERPIAVATLNRELACLKAIVNKAMQNRHLDKNPIYGLKLPKESNIRDRTLSREEYEKLLGACSVHLRLAVKLAFMTGMRRGEILGLRWAQVDSANRVIVLAAGDTKTNERREIPLSEELLNGFQGLPRVKECPFVFTFNGKAVQDVKTGFLKACGRAGIENFRFHDLRHCAVTNYRKAGISDKVIMSISGHKTTAMFRRYDSVDRGDRQAALDRLGDFLETSNKSSQKPSAAVTESKLVANP